MNVKKHSTFQMQAGIHYQFKSIVQFSMMHFNLDEFEVTRKWYMMRRLNTFVIEAGVFRSMIEIRIKKPCDEKENTKNKQARS